MSRGDHRETIFRDDADRSRFLETLAETCTKTSWQIQAYCLMPNHFHLVLETPQPNLVAGMKWFLGTYTGRFNRRHAMVGHLFSGRYKSQMVSGNGGYLRTVGDYVHLNPVRANLLPATRPLSDFQWSSFPAFILATKRPDWLRVDRILGECGIPKDSPAGRIEFERRLEKRRAEEISNEDLAAVRGEWCLGNDQFKAELLAQVAEKMGASHYGGELHEAVEAKADRIVCEELKRLDWPEDKLETLPKGDSSKIVIARRLRRETTMTIRWIAERLRMGTKEHLTHLLYWQKRLESGGKSKTVSSRKRPHLNPKSPRNTTILLTDPVAAFDTTFD